MTTKTLSCSWMLFFYVVLAFNSNRIVTCAYGQCQASIALDVDVLKFVMNFDFLEAEFFWHGSTGRGVDSIYPELASGGPAPIGAQKANLDPIVRKIVEEFGYQEVGALRIITKEVGGQGIRRPWLNLSKEVFSDMFDKAFGYKLNPPFDPYANTINYLLAATILPYTGQLGLVGAVPPLLLLRSRKLLTTLLAITAGRSAVIRTFLYQRANETVAPYDITVAKFVDQISALANQLGKCGLKDEGLFVPRLLGAENRTESNILSADVNSLSYSRTPEEILGIVYGTGNASMPRTILPNGANGVIAQSFRRPII